MLTTSGMKSAWIVTMTVEVAQEVHPLSVQIAIQDMNWMMVFASVDVLLDIITIRVVVVSLAKHVMRVVKPAMAKDLLSASLVMHTKHSRELMSHMPTAPDVARMMNLLKWEHAADAMKMENVLDFSFLSIEDIRTQTLHFILELWFSSVWSLLFAFWSCSGSFKQGPTNSFVGRTSIQGFQHIMILAASL